MPEPAPRPEPTGYIYEQSFHPEWHIIVERIDGEKVTSLWIDIDYRYVRTREPRVRYDRQDRSCALRPDHAPERSMAYAHDSTVTVLIDSLKQVIRYDGSPT